MIPFKEKPNESCVSLLQGYQRNTDNLRSFYGGNSYQDLSKRESRNSDHFKRETLETSPHTRDVRADSRQSRIDARDIRTDFQEIRTDLRDTFQITREQRINRDRREETDNRRNLRKIGDSWQYLQQSRRHFPERLIEVPLIDHDFAIQQRRDYSRSVRNSRSGALNNIQFDQVRDIKDIHSRAVSNNRRNNREDNFRETRRQIITHERSALDRNRQQSLQLRRESIERDSRRSSISELQSNENIRQCTQEQNSREPSELTRRQNTFENDRRRSFRNLDYQRERANDQLGKFRGIIRTIQTNNRGRILVRDTGRTDREIRREQRDTRIRSLPREFSQQNRRESNEIFRNRLNFNDAHREYYSSRNYLEPLIERRSNTVLLKELRDESQNRNNFEVRRSIRLFRDDREYRRNSQTDNNERLINQHVRELTSDRRLQRDRRSDQRQQDTSRRNFGIPNTRENRNGERNVLVAQPSRAIYTDRLQLKQEGFLNNQRVARNAPQTNNLSERLIKKTRDNIAYNRNNRDSSVESQHMRQERSQVRNDRLAGLNWDKSLHSKPEQDSRSSIDSERTTRMMSRRVQENRIAVIRNKYDRDNINHQREKREISQDIRNIYNKRSNNDSFFLRNVRDSTDNSKILPNFNYNTNILINAIQAILIMTLVGETLKNSSKCKLRLSNWRYIVGKEKAF